MLIYLIVFLFSILCFFCGPYLKKRQRVICVLIGLLLPTLLAGLRQKSIGTDTINYLVPLTNKALVSKNYYSYINSNIFNIWRFMKVSEFERGFTFVVYIVAKLTGSIVCVQAVCQLLVLIPIYLAMKNYQNIDDKSYWIGFSTYYLLIYNSTLNWIRQSIAMAFILLSLSYLSSNKNRNCVFSLLISIFFHKSAIVGVVILIIYRLLKSSTKIEIFEKFSINSKMIKISLIVLLGFISIIGMSIIMGLISSMGFGYYNNYLGANIKFMPNQIVVRLPILLVLILANKKNYLGSDGMFFIICVIYEMLISQLSSVNSQSARIAQYFAFINIISISLIFSRKRKRIAFLIPLITYFIVYWIYFYVYLGIHATVPYISVFDK